MNSPVARHPKGASRHAAALVTLALLGGCGGADAPTGPGTVSPSPSTAPVGGGVVAGRYVLRVTPSASCPMRATLAFPMDAVAAGTTPHPGVQLLVAGSDILEFELLSEAQRVSGGLGTTEAGALSNEGTRLWIRVIGNGAVTRGADGRGEVVTGRLAGYVAFGSAQGSEGSQGACDATDHAFTLRAS